MTTVGAVQEPHVEDEAGVLGEDLEEPPRDVGAEAADAGLRQVDIRDEERFVARLEHDVGQRLGRRQRAGAAAACTFRPQRPGQRVAERRRRRLHLGLGVARLDVEDEVELRRLGEAGEQSVEHGQSRLHRRLAASIDVDADARRSLLAHPSERNAWTAYASTRSICAPTPRRRSSIRS